MNKISMEKLKLNWIFLNLKTSLSISIANFFNQRISYSDIYKMIIYKVFLLEYRGLNISLTVKYDT